MTATMKHEVSVALYSVGPIEEFPDGLIVEFGDHAAKERGLLKYARRLDNTHAE